MKKIFILLVFFPFVIFAQSQTENYTETKVYKQPTTTPVTGHDKDKVMTTIQYFDGLGRVKQTIGVAAGGNVVSDNVVPIDWQLNNTATAFYNRNGAATENKVVNGATPFGATDLLWECKPDATSNADGGWNTDYFTIDNTKTYRYTVWVKRTASQAGTTYHGTQNVNNLSGTENNNPYFWAGDLPQLNTWYLMVGIVHPHSYTGGDTGESGVYDLNGNKVIDGTEYKWRPGIDQTRFRNYLYYCTDTNVRQYFWNPLAQAIDGTELSIQDIVNRKSAFVTEEKASDIVTHVSYDALGRQAKEYLPFASQSNNANIRTGDVGLTTQKYYQQKYEEDFAGVTLPTGVNAYSEKAFDGSPLNRVVKQAAPGKDWKLGSGHEIKLGYQTNGVNEVRMYSVATSFANNTYTPTLQGGTSYYGQGELYKTVTKDENWTSGVDHTTEEFKNKQEQVVLKRNYNADQPHDTYYVYDDFGNLTFVIPPKADTSDGISNSELTELCYQYKYDNRNRLVEKKVPGKGWEYIVYDKLDRPVLTQDPNLKSKNQWLFTKYDHLEREAYTGIFTSSNSRISLQQTFNSKNSAESNYETRVSSGYTLGGAFIYYSNSDFPTSITEVLTIQYYDDYLVNRETSPIQVNSYGVDSELKVKGLPTVSKVKVLGSCCTLTTTISYYDEKGRVIHSYIRNPYLGTTDIVESKLDDFTGKVLETKSTHKKTGKTDVVTVDRFEYDHMDRVVSQTQQINNQTSERIVKNNYDDLGQLASKVVGNGTKSGYKDITSGITMSNNEITKVSGGGWAVGLATQGSFAKDGYVEFIAGSDNTPMMIGLSNSNSNAHYNTINHAIYLYWTKRLIIYENGSHKGEYGKFAIGDVFRVERIGNTIHYKKNGDTFYVSKTTSSGSLLGDISMHTNGAKIRDFKIVDNYKGLQKTDYKYNVRGWLTSINEDAINDNDLFNFNLRYNTGGDPSKRLYNGHIAQTSWQTLNNDASTRAYTYTYDALNRITGAVGTQNDRYNVGGITYDKNGNILRLQRRGHTNTAATTFGLMDNLVYSYDSGNKLTKVLDNGNDNYGFQDGANVATEYSYDTNGNMKTDANKGITGITYNYLNLPTRVTITGKNIDYKYDAAGMKLRKTVNGVTTDYAGGYMYKNGSLQFFHHPEGYVENNNGTFNHIYHYKDHLGNIRLSYTDANKDGEITAPTTEIFFDDLSHSAGWNSVGALHGSSASIDSKHVVSGTKAVKLSRTGSGEVFAHSNQWITINNSTATDYIFSGWIYIETPSTFYGRMLLFMNENEETGYFTQIAVSDKIYEKNKWVYIEKRVTVPANIDKLNLRIDVYTNGAEIEGWFDDLRIIKVNGTVGNEIVEEKNYYPFGLTHKGYNNMISSLGNAMAKNFGYNGKERNEELGLEWYDFGARNYDAALGRWMNIDPLSTEFYSYSTYNSMINNPLSYVDPTGMSAEWVPEVDENGSVSYIAEEGDSASTLSDQYGISQEQAEEITGTNGDTEIKEGTKISGEKVADVTGSDVLKLDFTSDMATDQRKFDQILFANDYSRALGDTGFKPNDFFTNLTSSSTGFTLRNVNYSFEGKSYLVKSVNIIANSNWNWKISNSVGRQGSSMKDRDGNYSVNVQVYKNGGNSKYKLPAMYLKVPSHEAGELQDRLHSVQKVEKKWVPIKH